MVLPQLKLQLPDLPFTFHWPCCLFKLFCFTLMHEQSPDSDLPAARCVPSVTDSWGSVLCTCLSDFVCHSSLTIVQRCISVTMTWDMGSSNNASTCSQQACAKTMGGRWINMQVCRVCQASFLLHCQVQTDHIFSWAYAHILTRIQRFSLYMLKSANIHNCKHTCHHTAVSFPGFQDVGSSSVCFVFSEVTVC